MGLNILTLDDDPIIDVVTINECRDDDHLDDIETVSHFTEADDAAILAAGASALEGFLIDFRKNGIDQDSAKQAMAQMDSLRRHGLGVEGFSSYQMLGGSRAFTHERSIEGLAVANEEIAKTIKDAFARAVDYVLRTVKRVYEWFKQRFGKVQPADVKPTEAAKATAKRQDLEKIARFLDSMDKDGQHAGEHIARFAPGAPETFKQAIVAATTTLGEGLSNLSDKVSNNKTYARIVSGDISVRELVKRDSDEVISKIILAAADAAQNALKARNAAALTAALEEVTAATESFDTLNESVFPTDSDYEVDSESGVPLLTIVRNLKDAINSLESSDMESAIKETTARLGELIETAEQTTAEEIDEFIPEDAPQELRTRAVVLLMKLYSKLAGVGVTVSKLWTLRISSLRGINSILETIGSLITKFEDSMSREAAKLEQEPKDAFVKSMTGFGFSVEV